MSSISYLLAAQEKIEVSAISFANAFSYYVNKIVFLTWFVICLHS